MTTKTTTLPSSPPPTSLPRIQSTVSQKNRKLLQISSKLTPWYNSHEFEDTGQSLIRAASLFSLASPSSSSSSSLSRKRSNNKRRRIDREKKKEQEKEEEEELIQDVQSAIQRVALWRTRVDRGRLPLSIESTSTLAETMLTDYISSSTTNTNTNKNTSTTMTLRHTYASTIIRSVNGLADSVQRKSTYALSVNSLCTNIGLPSWVVDLRHDAAHNELPSLEACRFAAMTLLGFLGEKYWSVHGVMGGMWRGVAVEFLGGFKAAMKEEVGREVWRRRVEMEERRRKEEEELREQQQEEEEEEDGEDESEDETDHDDNGNDDMEDLDDGIWFVGMEDDNNKEKKESKSNHDNAKPTKNTTTTTTTTTTTSTPPKTPPQPQSPKLKPKQYLNNFLKTTPMDLGYQVLLSFLLYGGIDNIPHKRGVLIPGSTTSFPETEEGVKKVRKRYGVLLKMVCMAWTGFVQTLMVHLVDFILVIEEEEQQQQQQQQQEEEKNDGLLAATNNNNDLEEQERKKAGKNRKLYFLSSWVRYLVSREFHFSFDSSLAFFPNHNNSNYVDLSKKRQGFTVEEEEFLSKTAPLTALKRARLPLNSLCDRLCQIMKGCDGCGIERNTSKSILTLFTEILGEDRVEGMGILKFDPTAAVKEYKEIIKDKECNGNNNEEEDHVGTGNTPSKSVDGSVTGDKTSPGLSVHMSLEDMEAMLSDSESDDDDDADNDDKDDQGKEEESSNAVESKGSTPSKDDDGKSSKDCVSTTKKGEKRVAAWTLCDSWEECAIGTIPGYPS